MTDLEKLQRKVARIEKEINSLKTELENIPEHWRNKRSEIVDKIDSLKLKKRSVNKEIKSISIVISKPVKSREAKADDNIIRDENEKLKSESQDLTEKINKNSVLISTLKSKILNSNLKDKSVLKDSPVSASTQISFSVMYPNQIRETNAQYKELIEHKNEVLTNQELFINKLQTVVDQIKEKPDDKFCSYGYKNGNSKKAEERKANNTYHCDKCHDSIVKGSQYICLTIHGATSKKIPKKLYGGRQYYHTNHSNVTYRYHIGCCDLK